MKWIKEDIDADLVRSMSKRYNIDILTASILARRKIIDPGQVLYYLDDDMKNLHNPFLFDAMEDAVDRLLLAADEGEKVLVFGDSDTDGVTSTALIIDALAKAGIKASWKVPRGEEAYGLSMDAVRDFAAEGGTLIVTVDCGISNHEEVEFASSLGVDILLCDHHKLQAETPPQALAVIDPKIEGCGYPFRDLSGAGVAFKLAMALAFGRSVFYKQPIALLSISEKEKGRFEIRAAKFHNLVQSSSFVDIIEEDSLAVSDSLLKLSRFLSGRTIFTWQKASLLKAARSLFGSSIDIEAYDLADEAMSTFPRFAGKTLTELKDSPELACYASAEFTELDALEALFSEFAQRKSGLISGESEALLQLAALGTIADLMPLKDENRIIVKRGVASLSALPRQGLKELLLDLAIGKTPSATDLAWQVTPLLNAAGRIGKPEIALKLLMSEDGAQRAEAIEMIKQANGERKKMGSEVWEAVYPEAGKCFEANSGKYVLVGSASIKSGITGLLASRMVNTFKVPAIVAAFREDGTVVGSVRTSNGFKISGLLAECAEYFIDYGGHDAAAGFSLQGRDWEAFNAKAGAYLAKSDIAAKEDSIKIDAELPHGYVKPDIHKIALAFEPFGEDNPPLVFLSRAVGMVDAQIVGKAAKTHLKLTLDFGKYKWPALLWDGAERLERDFSFRSKDLIDIVYKVTMNRWNGEERPQLELYDLRRAQAGID
jgi:single-stranded-DNA-specific exonuclease